MVNLALRKRILERFGLLSCMLAHSLQLVVKVLQEAKFVENGVLNFKVLALDVLDRLAELPYFDKQHLSDL